MPRRSLTPESCASRSRRPSSASWLISPPRTGAGAARGSFAGRRAAPLRRRGRTGRFDSARPKSSGSFSRVVCATTRGPAKDVSAPGSARITSPRLAKLAVTPPVVGCASTEISTPPASCRSPTATTVFGSCISARMPSCMRAPPDAETEISAPASSAARSQARANRSPTTLPIEPPMNAKSIAATRQGCPSTAARPVRIASPSPVPSSASASRSTYGRRSKNSSGSADRRSPSSSSNVPGSASCAIRSRARTGKWCPHCGQTRSCSASSSSR